MNSRVSVFDDYRWNGSDLKDLSLYEYVKIIIRKRVAKHRTGSDINFHANHPEHGEKTLTLIIRKPLQCKMTWPEFFWLCLSLGKFYRLISTMSRIYAVMSVRSAVTDPVTQAYVFHSMGGESRTHYQSILLILCFDWLYSQQQSLGMAASVVLNLLSLLLLLRLERSYSPERQRRSMGLPGS
jgi:hypothetical protein